MPKDCINSLEEWLDECEKLFTGIDLAKIVNMDETSIYLDFPGKYSYAKKGSRRVKATTTGNERTRISAAVFQQILSSSNPNNIPTYENPTTKNKRTSTKKTTTLKDAECNICKIKFTKHDLTRHRNSCQAKAAKKS